VKWRIAGEGGTTLALGAALIAAAAAMAQPVETPPDHSQDIAWMNAQQAALAERAAQPGWQAIEGGTLWRRVAGDGSGRHPTAADTVTVHYTGSFVGGGVFDTSEGGEPATFPLGRLTPAWSRAIPHMGVGDTIEIAAPASEAYGTKGKGPIPGGATLLFTVRLIKIGG
jgi:FKBP-type peptidyl-prolyl cis-trans isomerase